ncbi:hypothetical protein AAGV33_00045 [Flavobacterium sp. FBOR7N2.3]|uniref:Uncharacterized protein n=1 Tax=Flavobacterium magnesitis TaxID=3138077 RepID=A0ABV4TF67_9FLAO
MAKAFGPIQLTGTLSDLNFYITPDGNIVRERGKTGNTKKSFRENPIFIPIKQHGKDFGLCAKKGSIFRQLVKAFYDHAKDGSIAGRTNQLLHAIIKEDQLHPRGSRQLITGLQSKEALKFLTGFEGNKARPLGVVLKKKIAFNWDKRAISLKNINPLKHIDWPENATEVHLQIAISNWNCEADTFETSYSNAIVLQKEAGLSKIVFELKPLQNKDLWLAFIHVRFSSRIYNTVKVLPNKWNTTTIIGCKWGNDL